MKMEADVVIVGTGVGGLFSALSLPRDQKIIMITKSDLESSDSFLAQGGICMLHDKDDYDSYFEDTMKAGHYENRKESVDLMIRSSREIIHDLIGYGVDFQKQEADESGNEAADNGGEKAEIQDIYAFTREGAHSRPRILFHADITGKEITSKLLAQVKQLSNVTLLEYTTMTDIIVENDECKGILAQDKDGNEYNSNKATISGLVAQTTYYYKVDDKEIKSFKTGNTGKFRFAFVGDPQIGSSNELKGSDTEAFYNAQSNAVANDSYNWSQTLKKIQSAGTDFIVSAGDQIQTTKKKAPRKSSTTSEIEYAGYLSPDTLASLPVATTVGNHDADNANYQYHFNVPNLSNLGDNGKVGGDYYFTYGDVLFMMLNTQDTNSAEHIQFIEETVAKNANCKWKVVTLHQDIYGSAEHSNEPEIVNLRYALTPTFEKYGIDVVLTGHDHAYSRSKFLSGNQTEKTVTYTDDEFDEMLDKDIDYTGEGTLTVAPGNIKADTTDESEKTYLSYLTSVMDADRITETGEYVVREFFILQPAVHQEVSIMTSYHVSSHI